MNKVQPSPDSLGGEPGELARLTCTFTITLHVNPNVNVHVNQHASIPHLERTPLRPYQFHMRIM